MTTDSPGEPVEEPQTHGWSQPAVWSLKSQSCPEDFDPAWWHFATRAEAEARYATERRENPTDLLTLYNPDYEKVDFQWLILWFLYPNNTTRSGASTA